MSKTIISILPTITDTTTNLNASLRIYPLGTHMVATDRDSIKVSNGFSTYAESKRLLTERDRVELEQRIETLTDIVDALLVTNVEDTDVIEQIQQQNISSIGEV